jgi:hypothetical protein
LSLAQTYANAMLKLPAMQEWIAAAKVESEHISGFEH